MKIKIHFIFLIFLLLLRLPAYSSLKVKIGVYENAPKIFTAENGNVKGFWADITSFIADKEDWDIEWVPGTWTQCLQRLENNEINVMVDVGLTPERQTKFTFSNETVLLSWTRLYRKSEARIDIILDLDGKTVGGLKGSFDLDGPEGLKAVTRKFELNCRIIELEDYASVLQALENGIIDAGITDKDFGNKYDSIYNVERTNIILQPARMLYAFPKGAELNNYLISTIDSHLKRLKANQQSVYYSSLSKYLGDVDEIKILPLWVKILLVFIFILIIIYTSFYLFLQREIRRKTQELRDDITIRTRVEAELRISEDRFRILFNNLNDMIIIYDLSGKILDSNATAAEVLGYSKDELKRMKLTDLIDLQTQNDQNNIIPEYSVEVSSIIESILIKKDGSQLPVEISLSFIELDGNTIIQGIIRDISERSRNQKELKNYREHLEELVTARTGELEKANQILEMRNLDMENMHKVFVGREFRIKELREQIKNLRNRLEIDTGSDDEV
ncbi:MAG: transporter substrate-binding domain-containing protein [Candidatus Cloacimonetes bacterium]|nr:transporter substrate-binding domain-containing protein [Candidatus Cloacimonadota bacterium]